MNLCEYGCGQEATHQFKNGKWCCSQSHKQCYESKRKLKETFKEKGHPCTGITHNEETKKKIGEKSKGRIHSIEARKKMSEANKGKKLTIEQKKFLSESRMGKNNPFYGKNHTEEAKIKIGIASSVNNKGIIISKNQRLNTSKIMKEKWKDPNSTFNSKEYRQKLSEGISGKIVSIETRKKISDAHKGINYIEKYGKLKADEIKRKIGEKSKNRPCSIETRIKLKCASKRRKITNELREKIRSSKIGDKNPMKNYKWSEKQKHQISKKLKGRIPWNKDKKFNLKDYKERHPFFYKIEELREDPESGHIQGRCKNHQCPNSKEKGGWFNLERKQITERIIQLEKEDGTDGSYFYCSDKCKIKCPLFGLNPNNEINKNNLDIIKIYYTTEEYQTFRQEVLKRANYKCEYCEEEAKHAHHSRPQKLEPFFSLDPDYGISCCKECHYEKGHKDECSTGQIANTICG